MVEKGKVKHQDIQLYSVFQLLKLRPQPVIQVVLSFTDIKTVQN